MSATHYKTRFDIGDLLYYSALQNPEFAIVVDKTVEGTEQTTYYHIYWTRTNILHRYTATFIDNYHTIYKAV